MPFLTAKKKDHVARCPAGRGGETYLGNARLKTFFFIWTPSLSGTEFQIFSFFLNETVSNCHHVAFDDNWQRHKLNIRILPL